MTLKDIAQMTKLEERAEKAEAEREKLLRHIKESEEIYRQKSAPKALMALNKLMREREKLIGALVDAIDVVGGAAKGSIGSINNVYLPQIDVKRVNRWRAILAEVREQG